jgi:hypothetical protein
LRKAIQRIEMTCDPRYRHGRAIRAGGYQRPMWGGGYGGGY